MGNEMFAFMPRMLLWRWYLILLVLLSWSCRQDEIPDQLASFPGYAPIYQDRDSLYSIRSGSAERPLQGTGKIYYMDYGVRQYVLIVEQGAGIHFYNNTNPEQPQKAGFIQIPGVVDVAIRDRTLVANNMEDLVTIDISDLNQIREISRIRNYRNPEVDGRQSQMYPEANNVRFECPDTSQGIIVGWQPAPVPNAKCFRE